MESRSLAQSQTLRSPWSWPLKECQPCPEYTEGWTFNDNDATVNQKLLMHWSSKYCFLLYFAHPYCPSQVRSTEDMVTSYNYPLQNRRAYSRTTPSILGVARPRARPTPKQLGIGIVVSAVTPLLQDEEQFSSPIFELGRPRFWSRTPPSPPSHDMSFHGQLPLEDLVSRT